MKVSRENVSRLRAELERETAELWQELRSASPEQRDFRPAPGAWTPVDVGHHLFLAERSILEAGRKRRADPARRKLNRPRLVERFLNGLVQLVLRSGIRVKAPSEVLKPQEPIPLDDLLEQWQEVRGGLEELLDAIPEAELGFTLFRHAVGGPLDVAQGLEFMVGHIRHHRRQLDRIRASSGFPAA